MSNILILVFVSFFFCLIVFLCFAFFPAYDREARDAVRKRHEDQGIPFFEASVFLFSMFFRFFSHFFFSSFPRQKPPTRLPSLSCMYFFASLFLSLAFSRFSTLFSSFSGVD